MNARICKTDPEWSKSNICRPKNNLISHPYLHGPKFKPSYEKEGASDPPMALLLSWEYSRIWQRENCEFHSKRIASEKLKPVSDPLEKVRRKNAEKKEKEKQKKFMKENEKLVTSKLQKKLEAQRLKTHKKVVTPTVGTVSQNNATKIEIKPRK